MKILLFHLVLFRFRVILLKYGCYEHGSGSSGEVVPIGTTARGRRFQPAGACTAVD